MEKVRSKLHATYPYIDRPLLDLSLDLQGWNSDHSVFAEYIRDYKPKLIVEVGTWKGASAIHMAGLCREYTNDFEIVCLDTFQGAYEMWVGIVQGMNKYQGRPTVYEQFISNVMLTNNTDCVTPFPIDTYNGFRTLQYLGIQADMIYIDAGHSYSLVKDDIINFSSILKTGGVLIGDDYRFSEVRQAAKEVIPEEQLIDRGDKFVWIK